MQLGVAGEQPAKRRMVRALLCMQDVFSSLLSALLNLGRPSAHKTCAWLHGTVAACLQDT
jgi:hypothetical protein